MIYSTNDRFIGSFVGFAHLFCVFWEGVVQRGSLSGGGHFVKETGELSRGNSVGETPGQKPPITVTTEWYASYWNAFLCLESNFAFADCTVDLYVIRFFKIPSLVVCLRRS